MRILLLSFLSSLFVLSFMGYLWLVLLYLSSTCFSDYSVFIQEWNCCEPFFFFLILINLKILYTICYNLRFKFVLIIFLLYSGVRVSLLRLLEVTVRWPFWFRLRSSSAVSSFAVNTRGLFSETDGVFTLYR